jgi:DNA polymerase IV
MHVDMDAFYASVEVRYRPELRGTPVIVGGFPRGVVLSATYEARAFGVRSGMSSPQARRLAPRATFVEPNFDRYTAVSKAIGTVFRSVTAVVEAASIDEAFLDLTGSVAMFGPPTQIGEYVRAVVADEQQITCSVGIGPTKFVAKMASRSAKPDGLLEIPPDKITDFLHPMPVEAMWGVGRPTAEKLNRLGIQTVGDLAQTPRGALRRVLGPHAGAGLVELAWGRDPRRVVPMVPERSVGSQQTFGADSTDPQVIRRELLRMADRTASRMRKQHVLGRTVSICVRFADFTEVNRSATVSSPTDVTEEIYAAALGLYDRLNLDRARVRRVGVRVEQLVDASRAYRQPKLTDPEFGWREADQAVDRAARRFGSGAVRRAVLARSR